MFGFRILIESPIIPTFHHSILPIFHHPNNPVKSILLTFHLSHLTFHLHLALSNFQ
jgi:hypothetical protein